MKSILLLDFSIFRFMNFYEFFDPNFSISFITYMLALLFVCWTFIAPTDFNIRDAVAAFFLASHVLFFLVIKSKHFSYNHSSVAVAASLVCVLLSSFFFYIHIFHFIYAHINRNEATIEKRHTIELLLLLFAIHKTKTICDRQEQQQ